MRGVCPAPALYDQEAIVPSQNIGSTGFSWPDILEPGAKVRIATAEGSTVAVPFDDLAAFIYLAYIAPQRQMRDMKKDWRDAILG